MTIGRCLLHEAGKATAVGFRNADRRKSCGIHSMSQAPAGARPSSAARTRESNDCEDERPRTTNRRRPGYLPACRWPARDKRRAAWRGEAIMILNVGGVLILSMQPGECGLASPPDAPICIRARAPLHVGLLERPRACLRPRTPPGTAQPFSPSARTATW